MVTAERTVEQIIYGCDRMPSCRSIKSNYICTHYCISRKGLFDFGELCEEGRLCCNDDLPPKKPKKPCRKSGLQMVVPLAIDRGPRLRAENRNGTVKAADLLAAKVGDTEGRNGGPGMSESAPIFD